MSVQIKHFSEKPFIAVCGADKNCQFTTTDRAATNCPYCKMIIAGRSVADVRSMQEAGILSKIQATQTEIGWLETEKSLQELKIRHAKERLVDAEEELDNLLKVSAPNPAMETIVNAIKSAVEANPKSGDPAPKYEHP